MGEDFRRKPDGDALGTVHEQKWEFGRQSHRLVIAAVVAFGPVGYPLIVEHIKRKRRQPGFDITPCGGRSTGQRITPVTLSFHKQLFLPELHQRIFD